MSSKYPSAEGADVASDPRMRNTIAKLQRAQAARAKIPKVNHSAMVELASKGAPGFRPIDNLIPVRTKDYLSTLDDEVSKLRVGPQPSNNIMRTNPGPQRIMLPSLDESPEERLSSPPAAVDWIEEGALAACNIATDAAGALRELHGIPAMTVLKTERDNFSQQLLAIAQTSDPLEIKAILEQVIASATVFNTVVSGWATEGAGDRRWLV